MTEENDDCGREPFDRRSFLSGAALLVAANLLPRAAISAMTSTNKTGLSLPPARPGAISQPKSFMWGVATAGHQIEGNNVNSDCWVLENVKPTLFVERSGDACDSYSRYEEDINLLKSLGFNSYRFSLEWARIEPNENSFSNAELDHYKRVIAYCHKVGVWPAVTFNHYTNPAWFAASGGYLRSDAPDLFARYCEVAAKHLADGIHVAFTLNEPEAGRIYKIFPEYEAKARPVVNAMAAAAARSMGSDRFVTWNTGDPDALLQPMIEAHKRGFAAIKSARGDLPVGVCLASIDYEGLGPNNRAEEMRKNVDGAWFEAIKACGDFAGVQNYFRMRFDDKGYVPAEKGVEVDYMGMEIYPPSLANAVRQVFAATGKPILVTENGLGAVDDTARTRYIGPTLNALGEAKAEGVPLLGYFHWSLLDNFEWISGYGPKYGLVTVDRKTFARTPKPSAHYIGNIARRNLL